MAASARSGEDWSDEENDLIVADYLDMLLLELAGAPYSKAERNRALQHRTGRSHGSIEWKHRNISAVLGALGRRTISGYLAADNAQFNRLLEAIERQLSPPTASDPPAAVSEAPVPLVASRLEFVPTPTREPRFLSSPPMRRLLRKFDPAERDARNRSLGEAGEAMVVEFERERLALAERPDLARRVRWVSKEDGDGAGYDVLSFTPAGAERLIEVKTTEGAATTPFFITRNECAMADERPDAFRLFRVHEFPQRPRLFKVRPPLDAALRLTPEVWKAGIA
jgi:hypothetical protein